MPYVRYVEKNIPTQLFWLKYKAFISIKLVTFTPADIFSFKIDKFSFIKIDYFWIMNMYCTMYITNIVIR